MQPRELVVKNFRSLKDLRLKLSETTVIIGENNSGKSAVLDAIRLALSHKWGVGGTGFREYDFHLAGKADDPKTSPAIEIDVLFWEEEDSEWPEEVVQDITSTINIDAVTARNSVWMRTKYQYDSTERKFVATWEFLDHAGQTKSRPTARGSNIHVSNLVKYAPVFSLAALRDAAAEFGNSSQFWKKLIQSIQIGDEDWEEIAGQLTKLNEEILSKDAKFEGIKQQLAELKKIFPPNSIDAVDLRALPLRIWDLIAKTELLVRATDKDPWLPLTSFGQGVQSIAVLNVFRAYVEHLLGETFEKESEPVLLMEEPEAHLHPHATRALYEQMRKIPGMKVVTTHSPQFVQNVPFRDLRLVRKVDGGTVVFQLEEFVRLPLPKTDELDAVVAKFPKALSYDNDTRELAAHAAIPDAVYRELLAAYTTKADREEYHPKLSELRRNARKIINGELLQDLEDQAKRIRGEIFFARKWLLVEGPAEYIVVQTASRTLGVDLDQQGVSLIDAKNHGSFGGFAGLARAFGFPWAMLIDGDGGGDSARKNVENQDLDPAFLTECVFQHGRDEDLEIAFANSLTKAQRVKLCEKLGLTGINTDDPGEVAAAMKSGEGKVSTAFILRDMLASGEVSSSEIPEVVVKAIEYILKSERFQ